MQAFGWQRFHQDFDAKQTVRRIAAGWDVSLIAHADGTCTQSREDALVGKASIFQQLSVNQPVREITCGWNHCLAIVDGGDTLFWGCNTWGQLGVSRELKRCNEPVAVPSLRGKRAQAVAAGEAHSLVLTEDGSVYVCGRNAHGLLGLGKPDDVPSPVQSAVLPTLTPTKGEIKASCQESFTALPVFGPAKHRVVALACSSHHSAVVTAAGEVWTWGLGLYGALGHGGTGTEYEPRLVEELSGVAHVTTVSCGVWHTAAVTDMGGVYCWGLNNHGQLGLGAEVTSQYRPEFVELPDDVDIVAVACGSRHTLALSLVGEVYAWGWDGCGQVTSKQYDFFVGSESEGKQRVVHVPQKVTCTLERKVACIAAGRWHSLVLFDGDTRDAVLKSHD